MLLKHILHHRCHWKRQRSFHGIQLRLHTRKEILNQNQNPTSIRIGGYFWKLKRSAREKWPKCLNIKGGFFLYGHQSGDPLLLLLLVSNEKWVMEFVDISLLLVLHCFSLFLLSISFSFSLSTNKERYWKSRALPLSLSVILMPLILSVLLSAFSKLKTEPSTEPQSEPRT